MSWSTRRHYKFQYTLIHTFHFKIPNSFSFEDKKRLHIVHVTVTFLIIPKVGLVDPKNSLFGVKLENEGW